MTNAMLSISKPTRDVIVFVFVFIKNLLRKINYYHWNIVQLQYSTLEYWPVVESNERRDIIESNEGASLAREEVRICDTSIIINLVCFCPQSARYPLSCSTTSSEICMMCRASALSSPIIRDLCPCLAGRYNWKK